MFPRYLMNSGQGMLGAAPMMTLTSASGAQAGRGQGGGGRRSRKEFILSLSPRLVECDPSDGALMFTRGPVSSPARHTPPEL